MSERRVYFEEDDIAKQQEAIRAGYLKKASETAPLNGKLSYLLLADIAPAVAKTMATFPNNAFEFVQAMQFVLATLAWNTGQNLSDSPDEFARTMLENALFHLNDLAGQVGIARVHEIAAKDLKGSA